METCKPDETNALALDTAYSRPDGSCPASSGRCCRNRCLGSGRSGAAFSSAEPARTDRPGSGNPARDNARGRNCPHYGWRGASSANTRLPPSGCVVSWGKPLQGKPAGVAGSGTRSYGYLWGTPACGTGGLAVVHRRKSLFWTPCRRRQRHGSFGGRVWSRVSCPCSRRHNVAACCCLSCSARCGLSDLGQGSHCRGLGVRGLGHDIPPPCPVSATAQSVA